MESTVSKCLRLAGAGQFAELAQVLLELEYRIEGLERVAEAAEKLVRYTNRDYAEWREPVAEALAKLKV